jgi:hypothetical protein
VRVVHRVPVAAGGDSRGSSPRGQGGRHFHARRRRRRRTIVILLCRPSRSESAQPGVWTRWDPAVSETPTRPRVTRYKARSFPFELSPPLCTSLFPAFPNPRQTTRGEHEIPQIIFKFAFIFDSGSCAMDYLAVCASSHFLAVLCALVLELRFCVVRVLLLEGVMRPIRRGRVSSGRS